jgi:hypothetical protein
MIPSLAPIAAPVIKPSMVVLVIDGELLTNIKPAAAIHKSRELCESSWVYSQRQRAAAIAIGCRCTAKEGNLSIG